MKAVMYHYVQPDDPSLPHFKHLHIDDFKRQLDFFEKEFGFAAQEDFLRAFTGGAIPRGVVLTFDDGLKDHYTHVFPELRRRGLWGIFYVPCGVYGQRKLLDAHRVHLAVGSRAESDVLTALESLIDDSMLAFLHREEFRTQTYRHHDEEEATKRVKRILNYFIASEHREKTLAALMRTLDLDEFRFDWYMPEGALKEMHESGMIIGSHTVTHPVMSTLPLEGQRSEIRDSFAFIERTVGPLPVKTFCYPYGGFHTFTSETEEILTKEKCLFSFNVEPRDITANDCMRRPQVLPRYDCNRFPHGTVRKESLK